MVAVLEMTPVERAMLALPYRAHGACADCGTVTMTVGTSPSVRVCGSCLEIRAFTAPRRRRPRRV